MSYETQLGLPVFLAYMDEHVFERLPLQEARTWPLRFIEAVPVGVDLELVFPRFMHWLLSDPDGMRQYANATTLPIIDTLATMYAQRIAGVPFDRAAGDAARAAWEAARAAWAAGAARAARAAWEAGAARAAWEAARAAWVAARAAVAAGEAEATQIRRQGEYLLTLLHDYAPRPILVYAPCEPHDMTIPLQART
jgi:hypothetical protein